MMMIASRDRQDFKWRTASLLTDLYTAQLPVGDYNYDSAKFIIGYTKTSSRRCNNIEKGVFLAVLKYARYPEDTCFVFINIFDLNTSRRISGG